MKNMFICWALMLTFFLSSCGNDDEVLVSEYMPVTYANIAGIWQLEEWNGEALGEGRYCYLVIDRKADDKGYRALDIYMNIDSDKSRHLTSIYELEDDEEMDEDPYTAFISGMYDYSTGFWNNSYIISELESDRMVWTVSEDKEDVSVYVRCDAVPEDILAGTRTVE